MPRRSPCRSPRRRPRPAVPAPLLGLGVVAVLILGPLAACASSAGVRPAATNGAGGAGGAACSTAAGPPGGMRVLTLAELPAQAVSTLRLIAAGGPYPYTEDGTVFGNYQRLLPGERHGYYREYTVAAAKARSRGPRRVVTGSGGQDYYSPDHYESFDWIACG